MPSKQNKSIILVITVVLAVFTASPVIQRFVVAPQTAGLTELSVLGVYHNATYPFNVTADQNYPLYLEINNHLGSIAYYQVEVKFRNATQSAPDAFNQVPSALPSLGNISICAANIQSVELPITISLSYQIDLNNTAQLDMQSIIVNGFKLNLTPTTITWDPQRAGFYGNLVFELWLFNESTGVFQYNQRFVSLWLNMTA
jgi:uncharacterized membrane protein